MAHKAEYQKVLNETFQHEGGFSNHKADRGGATKYGVTQRTLERWRKKRVTVDDVKNLSLDEAREIFIADYIELPKLHQLRDPSMFAAVVDFGYNSGPADAVRVLQKTLNETMGSKLKLDGNLGPLTAGLVNDLVGANMRRVLNAYVDNRIRFVANIMTHDASQAAFANGWIDRILKYRINQ